MIVEQNDNCFLDFKKIEFKDRCDFSNLRSEFEKFAIKVEKIIIENGEVYFQNIRMSLNNERKKVVKTFKGKWKYMDNYYLHKGNECLYFSFS